MSNYKAEVARRVTPVLAWSSSAAGLLGGAFLPGTPLGHILANAISILGWLAPVAFTVLFAWLLRDFGMDGEPNKVAVYSLMVLPSLAAATPGSIGVWVQDRCRDLVNWASAPLTEALGVGSATALTLALLAIAVIFAQRAVRSGTSKAAPKVTARTTVH